MVLNANREQLLGEVNTHDRLWDQTWLQDPLFEKAAKSYSTFKKLVDGQ